MSALLRCSSSLVALVALVGCQAGYQRPAMPIDSAAGLFEKAQLSYEVDASKLQTPISVARIEGQLVSYEQVPSSLREGGTTGQLEIEYPHPRGLAGHALARVRIESKFTAGETAQPSLTSKLPLVSDLTDPPVQVEEVWELDIPRAWLDQIVAQLNQARYFERDAEGSGIAGSGVAIQTSIDGHAVNKTWDRVSELDRLMVAVRSHGQLVSYQRSPTTQKLAGPPPASIAAYRAYAAGDGAFGASPDRYLAGGYALPGVSANPATGYGLPNAPMIAAHPAAAQPRVSQLPTTAYPVR